MKLKNKHLAAASVLLSAALWGCMGICTRYFIGLGLSSLAISALRILSATLMMLPVVALWKPALFRIRLRDFWCFFGTGILSLTLLTVCYFQTIAWTSVAVAAVLLYMAPIIVMILSAVIFKEKITAVKAIACLLAVAGCVLVSAPWGSTVKPLAVLTGLLSAFFYALYSIFSRFALQRGYDSVTIILYTFIFSAVGVLPFSRLIPSVRILAQTGWKAWAMLVTMGLVTAVLPYFFYTIGLTALENSKASVMASFEPVVAAIAGAIVLHEFPGLIAVLGMALVLGGVTLLNVRFKKM